MARLVYSVSTNEAKQKQKSSKNRTETYRENNNEIQQYFSDNYTWHDYIIRRIDLDKSGETATYSKFPKEKHQRATDTDILTRNDTFVRAWKSEDSIVPVDVGGRWQVKRTESPLDFTNCGSPTILQVPAGAN